MCNMRDNEDSDSVNRRSIVNRLSQSKADEEVPERKRRSLMKGMAMSALSAFGLTSVSNSVAAKESEDCRAVDYTTVESVLQERTEVRQLLANNGLIADAAVETLTPDTVATPDDGRIESVYETEYNVGDGVETFVRIKKLGSEGEFSVGFQRDGDRFFIDTPETFDDDVLLEDWNDEPVSKTWNDESASATSAVSPNDNTPGDGGGGGSRCRCEQPIGPCGGNANESNCYHCHHIECIAWLYPCENCNDAMGYWCSCCCGDLSNCAYPCCSSNDPAC